MDLPTYIGASLHTLIFMSSSKELLIGYEMSLTSRSKVFSTISSGNSFLVFQPRSISASVRLAFVFAIFVKSLFYKSENIELAFSSS